ncbi:hypothetical protein NHX12_030392 [Muraenolepis orangiensis]|uniref:Uncharacterized protein n=1 Tax=Muraenolepis orangiensis TaxID=630683 RepID=A0A9Q0EBN5_9TELE|nr:hypothetical protein NHX12_030392 [Muraenolepis orangiensis]
MCSYQGPSSPSTRPQRPLLTSTSGPVLNPIPAREAFGSRSNPPVLQDLPRTGHSEFCIQAADGKLQHTVLPIQRDPSSGVKGDPTTSLATC